jgi:uncharacterized protein (DUF58 family)
MSGYFLPLLIILLVIAAFLREDFVFTLIYLLAGAFAFGRWWSRKALKVLEVQRKFPERAFLGEEIQVELELSNPGLLPVVWVRLHESLPVEMAVPNFFRRVISLGPHERVKLDYLLKARKRGYYPIGPLNLQSGDLLGITEKSMYEWRPDYLTVYPRIVPLAELSLPTHSPMGTLHHHEPIFEDPTRVIGKRDYMAGDSFRRIDWKSSAALGRLQVKKFEPSISMESSIFLNLNAFEYEQKTRYQTTELAIVVAASLATWIESKKQPVGLVTNGQDPLALERGLHFLPPRKGRSHLMRILDVLARIQMAETAPLAQAMRSWTSHLSWGTTVVLVTGQIEEDLFDELFQARRSGLDAMLVVCGNVPHYQEIQVKASHFGFPIHQVLYEEEIKYWM